MCTASYDRLNYILIDYNLVYVRLTVQRKHPGTVVIPLSHGGREGLYMLVPVFSSER